MTVHRQTTSALDPCRSIVVGSDRVHFGFRKRVDVIPQVPRDLAVDPGWLFNAASGRFDGEGVLVCPEIPIPDNIVMEPGRYGVDNGQVIVGESQLSWGGLLARAHPVDEQLAELRKRLADAGWDASDSSIAYGAEWGWTTWNRPGCATVHLCQLSHPQHLIDRKDQLVYAEDGHKGIAAQLAAFHAGTGVAWRGGAGVTMHQMILSPFDQRKALRDNGQRVPEHLAKRKTPQWFLGSDGADKLAARLGTDKIKLVRPRVGQGPYSWARTPTPAEKRMQYVHHYDGRAMYLAALLTAIYAWGDLTYVDSPVFEPAWAGFWGLSIPKGAWYAGPARNGYPPILRVLNGRRAWAATPTVALLTELDAPFTIDDAWICEDSGRVHRSTAERLRDLLLMGGYSTRITAQFKQMYSHGVGLFNREGGRIFRPDWAATAQEQSAAQVYRCCARAANPKPGPGFGWPLEVDTDSVWYASDSKEESIPLSIALGARNVDGRIVSNIGRMRYEGFTTMREYLKG
jgi:hypothetical protein